MSSDLKVTNIKHESSSSNNLVLASDGTTTVSGALTASGGIKVADGGNIGSASDADAMAISSTGVVTQSALPYIRVKGTAGTTAVTNGSRLPLHDEILDQGGHWNNSDYYFLTPVTGVYLISLKIYQYQADGVTIQYKLQQSDNDSSFSNTTDLGRLRIDATVSGSDHDYPFCEALKIDSGKRVFWINNSGSTISHYASTVLQTTLSIVLIG